MREDGVEIFRNFVVCVCVFCFDVAFVGRAIIICSFVPLKEMVQKDGVVAVVFVVIVVVAVAVAVRLLASAAKGNIYSVRACVCVYVLCVYFYAKRIVFRYDIDPYYIELHQN